MLTGYALAAGSVIMMGADWRFLNEDKARISFPKVMLGVSIPSAMIAMLRLHAGERFMKRLFQKPLGGFRAVKKNLRRDILALFENDPSLGEFEELMGDNFSEALLAVIEKRRPRFKNP